MATGGNLNKNYGYPVPTSTTFPSPIVAARAPTTSDIAYPLGQSWIYQGNACYTLIQVSSGSATWAKDGDTSVGAIDTLTGGSGGAIAPVAGNVNLNGTANQITSTGTAGTITFSLPSAVTAPGSLTTTTSLSATTSVTAGTTVTATLGNITATNGNLSLATAGNKIVIATGSNASVGTSGNMSGTPGVVTVATTACSATAKVFYCRATTGGTPGQVSITAQDATGFTLTSTGNETSTFNWWIINN